jgi:hypothetical protein
MVRQSRRDATACIYLKIFTKFFLFIRYFLLSEFSLSVSFGVTWSLSMSIGSYAQGLWLSGSLGLSVCSCSVLVPVCLPSGPCDAFWIYLPGSGSQVPQVGGVVGWC